MHFETYIDSAKEHRWRLIADNGNTVADSGEGYTNYGSMLDTLGSIQREAGRAEITHASTVDIPEPDESDD